MKAKIDYKEITKIIDLLEERNLSEFELEIEDLKIKISRASQKTNSQEMTPVAPPVGSAATSETPTQTDSAEDQEGLHFITSPMVHRIPHLLPSSKRETVSQRIRPSVSLKP
jgi:oxaloacetate decarboxylase alpha subunit/acetyl-CoA carboxylase biotin carboxyl carrier protein